MRFKTIVAKLASVKRHTPDMIWIIGLALVAFGIGMVFLPAGVIASGLALCFTGYALGGDGE